MAFKKTFSYAGFEQQPKRFENPKVLLLNIELELKAEKDNAEIRVNDPAKFQSFVDAEWNIIYSKVYCEAAIPYYYSWMQSSRLVPKSFCLV